MPKLSVAMPVYEMKDGAKFLRHSLRILKSQTFRDFEVVVSDNSAGDELKNVCRDFSSLEINYFKSDRKGMAPNSNAAIEASKGELVKILYQDDFLSDERSLHEIVDNFISDVNWLVTGCAHLDNEEGEWEDPHMPTYNPEIFLGKNTIGSPSVLTIRNSPPFLFDENLTWLLDCDLYRRLYDEWGEPAVLDVVNVIIRRGEHQMTNLISAERKQWEQDYLIKKYS